jgi:hypothetical protein
MEREASGQGGRGGLILPYFVLDVRRRTGTGVGLWSPTFLARRLGQRRPFTSVLWLGPPVRLGLIVGSFDVVANFDVRTVTSPFRSG